MARRGKAIRASDQRSLIAIIGDEDTITGFLLTGIAERNHKGETNFYVVDNSTPQSAIEEAFQRFITRPDIAILLINQHIAEKEVRHLINNYHEVMPTILEIPSKDTPYDPDKDTILQLAARKLFGSDKASNIFS